MNNYEKILEIRELDIKRNALVAEMRQFIHDKIEAEREFAEGEVVSVFSDNGKFKENGIIEKAKISVGLSEWEIMQYAEKEERYHKELARIVYGVKKIKKDGTKSAHNVNYAFMPAKGDKYGSYIEKKIEETKTIS